MQSTVCCSSFHLFVESQGERHEANKFSVGLDFGLIDDLVFLVKASTLWFQAVEVFIVPTINRDLICTIVLYEHWDRWGVGTISLAMSSYASQSWQVIFWIFICPPFHPQWRCTLPPPHTHTLINDHTINHASTAPYKDLLKTFTGLHWTAKLLETTILVFPQDHKTNKCIVLPGNFFKVC